MKDKGTLSGHKVFWALKASILAGMAFFLFRYAGAQSFWSDEMSTIGYIRTGTTLAEVIRGYMVDDAVNLPLYPAILYFFYRIMPYGETWLLIPSIFFCIGALIVISEIGRRNFSEGVSLASVCFGAISIWLIYRGAWDIRCYTLLVFLSALTQYFYAERIRDERFRNILLYGIAMLFLFYTHWFGAVQMLLFALCDLILFLRKKIRFRCILSYLISGGLLLPYVIVMLLTTTRDLGGNNAASDIPDLDTLKATLYYVAGERYVCFLLLIIGLVMIAVRYLHGRKKESIDLLSIMMASFIGLVGGVFFYCAHIDPSGTFYENKYFMVAMPQVLLIMSYAISTLIRITFGIADKMPLKLRQTAKALAIVGVILYYGKLARQNLTQCYDMAHELRMPYRQCAEYLSEEGGIYRDDVLVISTETMNLTEAWLDYYFVKRGARPPVRTMVQYADESRDAMEAWDPIDGDEIKSRFDKIIVFSISFPWSDTLRGFLDENYVLTSDIYEGSLSVYEIKEG